MKQGGLTYTDESMLLDIKDHFQQRLEERGISLDYLWLEALSYLSRAMCKKEQQQLNKWHGSTVQNDPAMCEWSLMQ